MTRVAVNSVIKTCIVVSCVTITSVNVAHVTTTTVFITWDILISVIKYSVIIAFAAAQ